MNYSIIPPHLSIKAMRSSGYKDCAYALAELIDNSIQAGETVDRPVRVEVICVDRSGSQTESGRRQLDRIAVYDNASGMDEVILRRALMFGVGTHLDAANQKGIGKFGMGLPNSSISQCRRVDVWTWRGGACIHTYLDIDEIERGEVDVPKPTDAVLPTEWRELIAGGVEDSGTLVVWSQLDLVRYTQSTALLRNAEFLVGRIYRHFLEKEEVSIRLAAYERTGASFENTRDYMARQNDPLFLMTGTTAPAPYDADPAFEAFGDPQVVEVGFRGRRHPVTITASICKPATRMAGGNTPIGKLAAKNLGVSVVRAGRELELNHSFENSYDPRERWWGIEVSFEPELDEVFGVTNNKQGATEFRKITLAEDADAEGLSVSDYSEQLRLDNDPRLVMYEISKAVEALLATMRKQVNRMRDIEKSKTTGDAGGSTAENIATRALRRRQEKLGRTGSSDEAESAPDDQRQEALTEEIREHEGVDETTARGIAVDYVSRRMKFRFRQSEFSGSSVFDVTSKAGLILITINTRHPAHEHLFELLEGAVGAEQANPALQALELLLTAWARMEDEAVAERKQELEDIRADWGRIARDFLKEAD